MENLAQNTSQQACRIIDSSQPPFILEVFHYNAYKSNVSRVELWDEKETIQISSLVR